MDSDSHWIFDCPHFQELRDHLPVLSRTLEGCKNETRGFATIFELVSLLKKVQIQSRIGVSLGSFIRQAISLRESWMREVCARGRHCVPPDHWSRNLFLHPPSDADFPAEVAEKFNDGHPWFQFIDEISDV